MLFWNLLIRFHRCLWQHKMFNEQTLCYSEMNVYLFTELINELSDDLWKPPEKVVLDLLWA